MTYRLTDHGKAQVVGLLMKHGNMQVQGALINESILAALFGYVEQQTNSGLYEVGRWRLGSGYTRSGYTISMTLGTDCFRKE